jgi:hypothetical protein
MLLLAGDDLKLSAVVQGIADNDPFRRAKDHALPVGYSTVDFAFNDGSSGFARRVLRARGGGSEALFPSVGQLLKEAHGDVVMMH